MYSVLQVHTTWADEQQFLSSTAGSGRPEYKTPEGETLGVASIIIFLGSWDLTNVSLNFYSFLARKTIYAHSDL